MATPDKEYSDKTILLDFEVLQPKTITVTSLKVTGKMEEEVLVVCGRR